MAVLSNTVTMPNMLIFNGAFFLLVLFYLSSGAHINTRDKHLTKRYQPENDYNLRKSLLISSIKIGFCCNTSREKKYMTKSNEIWIRRCPQWISVWKQMDSVLVWNVWKLLLRHSGESGIAKFWSKSNEFCGFCKIIVVFFYHI